MERTLSQEERIKRAEEIYNRRKSASGSGIRVYGNSVNVSKNRLSLFKKMALQLAICAVIYIIFYLIKHTNYIFSEDVINKTKELLSYDINFGNLYSQVNSFIEQNKDKFNIPGIEQEQNQIQGNTIENNIQNVTNDAETGGIGGAQSNEAVEVSSNENTEKTQMEIDAEYIKEHYSFKLPIKGTVTSRYGSRQPTDIISANHQGIDIGANMGTAIYAAMEGTVTLVSSEGDYGKHVEITNGEVMTRYAHCNKIVVKQGEKIKQGQKIAEVGQTGKATGPHLHFEVRRNNRTINPEYILKF